MRTVRVREDAEGSVTSLYLSRENKVNHGAKRTRKNAEIGGMDE
jgi:hypothetical protein